MLHNTLISSSVSTCTHKKLASQNQLASARRTLSKVEQPMTQTAFINVTIGVALAVTGQPVGFTALSPAASLSQHD